MLDRLRLSHYKCYRSLDLALSRFTLFAGPNGAGKTTALQPLLLLHQALQDGRIAGNLSALPLNGSVVSPGSFGDVLHEGSETGAFAIGIDSGGGRVDWTFCATRDREDLHASVQAVTWTLGDARHSESRLFPTGLLESTMGSALFDALATMRYVPADRAGPTEVYPLHAEQAHQTLGARADRAIGELFWLRDRELPPDKRRLISDN